MGTRNAVRPLSEAAERRLLTRVVAGDQNARRRLIEAYLGMVVSALARRYARKWGVPLEDLMQEGALALVQAVDHYDPNRGMKLSTYATWWVKQAILRAAMAQSRPVRVPERLWQMAGELSYEEQHSGLRSGQVPQDEDSTGASPWSEEELEEVRRALLPVASLETQVGDDMGELGELLPDPSAEDPAEVAARDDARHRLAQALSALPERERTVLVERTGFDREPRSLMAIGKDLGVSRERVRQLEGTALRELRDHRRDWGLEGLAA
jgi:RNA polymerase primary sigma factor